MVVLSQSALNHFSPIETCRQSPTDHIFTEIIPVIDLKDPEAKTLIVNACKDVGFFKLINHGVPFEFVTELESLAIDFFNLPQSEKDKAGPANPFGYGNKRIGPNGDVGWVEYLLFHANQITSHRTLSIFLDHHESLRHAMQNYLREVKRMTNEVLELITEGLGIEPKTELSRLLKDEKSDSCFRLNHYPTACRELETLSSGSRNLIGFGEHTDPQIISVLRSNNSNGFQICLSDGTWVSVAPDPFSFFINVGDALQVYTNGKFRSVKHRVITDAMKSRVSMIFFGGPPLSEKIKPLPSLMEDGEESLYKEFTWFEYKASAYKSKLADYRLGQFEIKTIAKC